MVVGVAVTVAPVVALRFVFGAHVYVLAPLAVSEVEPPTQNVADEGDMDTVGDVFIVTVTASLDVLSQPLTVWLA